MTINNNNINKKNKLFNNNYIKEMLFNAFDTNKMPHSWLIYGPDNSGKFKLIQEFMEYIFSNIDNVSSRILIGTFPDVKIIDKGENSEINITSVRELLEFAFRSPIESKYKVIIINGAEDLNKNSSNALLKLIEEPPKNSFIFLITNNISQIIPTIRSRCRKVALNSSINQDSSFIKNKDDILEIYKMMLNTFIDTDLDKLNKFIGIVDVKDPKLWKEFKICLFILLSKIIKKSIGIDQEEIFNEENIIINNISQKKYTLEWLDIAKNIENNLSDINNINLDRKIIITNIYNYLI